MSMAMRPMKAAMLKVSRSKHDFGSADRIGA
jgi:hypothetical protein